jgi:elongation factor G
LRTGVISRALCPVFLGSAYKNKGIQPLLDGVVRYLPCPADVENTALDVQNGETAVTLSADPEKPAVALAFKLEDGPFGQLTHIRLYQGSVQKGDELRNTRTGKTVRLGRLVRMHANNMEEIRSAHAGDLVALFGVDCASGDTFTDPSVHYSMSSMHVPDPVISVTVAAPDSRSEENLAKALARFVKEDPTFRSFVDPETAETIIQGMGELHLDVYVERIRREYRVPVRTGRPQVAFREAVTRRADFVYVHKKQTGGAGQFAKVEGYIEPCGDRDFSFESKVRGGRIPTEFIPAVEKGFKACMKKGRLTGFPVTGLRAVVTDGQAHAVDSSDLAFQQAAAGAFTQTYAKAGPWILEPVMMLAVEGPSKFQGALLATVHQRRGIIIGTTDDGSLCRVEAEVPLAEMFGYATALRSATQGKAEFTMEFLKYGRVPQKKYEDLVREYQRAGKRS